LASVQTGGEEGSDLSKMGLPKGKKQTDIHARESLPEKIELLGIQ
jgi:hypothetical protein